MGRNPRIVIPNVPHHAVQRGNNHQNVFLADENRLMYLKLLREKSMEYGLEVIAYCLMTNHVHLIVIPRFEGSLAKGLGRTHFLYTLYFNQKYDRCGHLWHNRFYSCPLDDEHFWAALLYIERNPVRAQMTNEPWNFPWSSAAAHIGRPDGSGLLDLTRWKKMMSFKEWRSALRVGEKEKHLEAIRYNTLRGKPLGGKAFMDGLEEKIKKCLKPHPVGRPRMKS